MLQQLLKTCNQVTTKNNFSKLLQHQVYGNFGIFCILWRHTPWSIVSSLWQDWQHHCQVSRHLYNPLSDFNNHFSEKKKNVPVSICILCQAECIWSTSGKFYDNAVKVSVYFKITCFYQGNFWFNKTKVSV